MKHFAEHVNRSIFEREKKHIKIKQLLKPPRKALSRSVLCLAEFG